MILIDGERPAAEPVTLAEAKGFARIERDDEDALLADLVRAAREWAEVATGLLLARRTVRLAIDGRPPDGRVILRRGPMRSVGTVTAFAADGAPLPLAANTVAIDADGFTLRLDRSVTGPNGIEVELEAGYEPDAVPGPVRLAILKIVVASYEMRASVPAAMQPGYVPGDAARLLAPFRRVRL